MQFLYTEDSIPFNENLVYSPCFCGSGKKYKFCCKAKSRMPRKSFAEVTSGKLNATQEKVCLCKDISTCQGSIINSHTIQRKQSLISIVDNTNHVYQFTNITNYLKYGFDSKIKWKAQKVGWKQASTVPALCEKHDRELFSSIDSALFSGNDEQIIASSLRSTIYSEYMINKSLTDNIASRDNLLYGNPLEVQKQVVFTYKKMNELQSETLKELKKRKKNHIGSSIIKFNYVNIFLSGEPEIFSAGTANITHNISATSILQNEYDIYYSKETEKKEFESFSISSLKTDSGVCYSYVWPVEFTATTSYFKDIVNIEENDLIPFLIQFLFIMSENNYFSINWWNSLNEEQQNNLKELSMIRPEESYNFLLHIDKFKNISNLNLDKLNFKLD